MTASEVYRIQAVCHAVFRWKFLHPHTPNPIRLHTLPRRKPQIVAEFRIEITLTKQRISKSLGFDTAKVETNEFWFTDDAFRPKEYNLCLREGRFLEPHYGLLSGDATFLKKYSLYLEFDLSPYPPRHEWKEPDGEAQAVRLWDYTQFCSREPPSNAIKTYFYDNCLIM
ncbi:uncharacterized protein ASPGLDRAFT_24328 [Aspergillus glaucus CBS 516.65]|uniref:Uncharacterized protein n=1 Tax=Aspergillus glaucus CBS 516.65 TaxID=1160497 RepID=A0A1L9VQK0_ASPGL|nr:hypothetical protein ASPGLDRAFT_24328 [Aspergillus glaucus CBS 516.65]OJJ86187.1 hypothetical protein ASPGLDRAFT_24328 [Aspergillus glaucus CBS 516.65]